MNAHRIGGCPIAARPEKPVPNAAMTRPGASWCNETVCAALTSGRRWVGISTPGPSSIVEVTSAARCNPTHTSSRSNGVSNKYARRYPIALWQRCVGRIHGSGAVPRSRRISRRTPFAAFSRSRPASTIAKK
jgi:hypothetical protein